jgi:hypothetical protein
MSQNTVTLAIEGEISLTTFATVMQRFTSFVQTLSGEIGKDVPIAWTIDDLQPGSALVTIRGDASRPELVERVVRAYATISVALGEGQPIPYPETITQGVYALTQIIQGPITALRFLTDASDVLVTSPRGPRLEGTLKAYALGALEGTIYTLSRRRRLECTLYDALLDQPVHCYLRPDQEEDARQAWGKRVRVSGRIGRDALRGHAVEIRDIDAIQLLPDTPAEAYTQARGILQFAEPPEVLIRKLRDAE